ncbi:Uncharacterised protein [Salmonella enterica]|nr:Uncharacterised protein [Salmonella enterica]
MPSHHTQLFTRLTRKKMYPPDVNACLAMPQGEFLQVLIDGLSAIAEHRITRIEFAKMSGLSQKNVYSYFASPNARDFRALSDEMRIAIIWRIFTENPYQQYENQKNNKIMRSHLGGSKLFIVNGEILSITQAAVKLGYSSSSALGKRISAEKIEPGSDISTLQNKRPGETAPKLFVVNGVEMNITKASRVLGYATPQGLGKRIKKKRASPGADISTYTKWTPW